MFFKTPRECADFAKFQGLDPAQLEQGPARIGSGPAIHAIIEDAEVRPYVLAKRLATWLGSFSTCLLWVTEYGVWPSNENRHLYYRLRQSYGDVRHLHDAPGHEFLDYEVSDLITFAALVIDFGWGGHFLCPGVDPYVFVSHDGWLHVQASNGEDAIVDSLDTLGIAWHRHRAGTN